MVKLGFSGLCFEWVLMVYVLVDCFNAFQAKMSMDLRWYVHSDLCELNIVFFETIVYVSDIIVSCF
jgi:hypothetical protein